MEEFFYFIAQPSNLLIVVGILGLIVGSFLNVVIYRLPIMMEREWRKQCSELLAIEAKPELNEPFNLSQPRSKCPHCDHQISVLENIPIFSYVWQRGKCTACGKAISFRYPLIEAISAILAIIVAWQFGFGWPLLGALALTWALLAASVIDIDHKWLLDDITLPFLWIGLICNLFGLYTDIESSVIGAMAGYLILWSVYWLFKLVTGKEGMGYGDFKLLAMLGAFLGLQALPIIILMASLTGAIVGITLIILGINTRDEHIPFGPYLAAAGWLTLLGGEALTNTYFSWVYP